MVSADMLSHTARMMQLADVLLFETYRKRLYPLRRVLTHQRDYCAGINSAGKESAERHFRHQPHSHRVAQHLHDALARFVFRQIGFPGKVRLPVPFDLNFAFTPAQPVSRLELPDAPVSGEWRGHAQKREIVMQSCKIDVPAN